VPATRIRSPRLTRPRPTLRGWVLGAVGFVFLAGAAWLGRVDMLLVGVFFALLPLGAMLALAIDRPWLSVARSFAPEIVATGDDAQAALTVRNEAARATPSLMWHDTVHAGLRAPEPAPLPWLAEHGPATTHNRPDVTVLRYRIGTQHRGVYEVGPLVISRTDPFGLAYGEYAVGTSRPLLVTPRIESLPRSELDTSRSEGVEHELLRQSIPSADELIAREYRTGDPLRRVHWRATARHDKLMVRQEEQRSNPNAWILFDTARGERRPLPAHTRNAAFEKAVSVAASVGGHLLDEGFVVNVVETGPVQFVGRTGAGRSGTHDSPAATFELPGGDQQLLASLAGVRQSDRESSDYLGILADGVRRSGRAVPVFLVLADGELRDADAVSALRTQAEPAVAFLLGAARRLDSGRLAEDGWTCVAVDDDQSVVDAWREAIRSHAAARAHG
jgi:uncharacterized protein (DUF58 family)